MRGSCFFLSLLIITTTCSRAGDDAVQANPGKSSNTLQVTAYISCIAGTSDADCQVDMHAHVEDSNGYVNDAVVTMGPLGSPFPLPLDLMSNGGDYGRAETGLDFAPYWELSVKRGADFLTDVLMDAAPDTTLSISPASPAMNTHAKLHWDPVDRAGTYSRVFVKPMSSPNNTYQDSDELEATSLRVLPAATFPVSGVYRAVVNRTRAFTLAGPLSTGRVMRPAALEFTVP